MLITETKAPNEESLKSKVLIFDLEALRGVAAFVVVWNHLIIKTGWLDPAYQPSGTWAYAPPAHQSVLLFFLLSGYVIGLAHATPLSKNTVSIYLKKRFFRLYPIYLISFLLAVLVATRAYPLSTIINHLAMTQGITSPVIPELEPAWSLTYEVVFYFLFIPLSIFRINPIPAALLAFLAGCLSSYLHHSNGWLLLSSFLFGFAFWLTGLSLAKYAAKYARPTVSPSYATMASLLLVFLALGKLNASARIAGFASAVLFDKKLLSPDGQPGTISFEDFGYLPYCIITVAAFSGNTVKQLKIWHGGLILLPALSLYFYYKNFDINLLYSIALPLTFYGVAVLLYVFPQQLEASAGWAIKKLRATGAISYALYIVHFPILFAFGRISGFSGSAYTFVARLIIFLVLIIGVSYLLEKRFQPWVRARFFK